MRNNLYAEFQVIGKYFIAKFEKSNYFLFWSEAHEKMS